MKPITKFVLLMTVCILSIQHPSILKNAHAAEKYERKSISFLNQILLTPNAVNIPADKASELMAEVNKKVEMPRFDYNPLSESLQTRFWSESRSYLSQTMQSLNSIRNSLNEIDRSIDNLDYRIERMGKSTSANYITERKKLQDQKRELSDRRNNLIPRQKEQESLLFKQVEELLTKVVAPELHKILSDPELQRLRAEEFVSEEDRNKFIVMKAKELGITGEDLEKVMSSAYLYIIALTNYSRDLTKDQTTGERLVTYRLSGGIIWFKFTQLEDQLRIEILDTIMVDQSASANPDKLYPLSTLDGDTGAFRKAIGTFADKLQIETLNIDDFALKTGVTEVSGSKARFPMGKKEGIFIDQKFRVYEKEKRGEEIVEKKRGFFYVDRIGDNVSDRDKLSRGHLVIRGAEPGMQIREYPNTGIDVGVRFSTGQIKLSPGNLISSPYGLEIKEEADTSVYGLNLTLQYDLGREIKIPQTFFTVGGDIGLMTSTENIVIQPYNDEPDIPLYIDAHAGFMKKLYIFRLALYLEPLIQYQTISLPYKNDNGDSLSFNNYTVSFSPRAGVEFAVREDINIGLGVCSNIPITSTDKWSRSFKSAGASEAVESGKGLVGPEVTYPKMFFSVYISYCLPKLW